MLHMHTVWEKRGITCTRDGRPAPRGTLKGRNSGYICSTGHHFFRSLEILGPTVGMSMMVTTTMVMSTMVRSTMLTLTSMNFFRLFRPSADRIWNIYIISKCFFSVTDQRTDNAIPGSRICMQKLLHQQRHQKTSIVRQSSTLNNYDDHVKSQIGCRFWIVVLSWYRGHPPHPVLVDTTTNHQQRRWTKNSSSLCTVFVTLA